MIPSVLSRELKEAIKGYLRAIFPFTTPFFHGLVNFGVRLIFFHAPFNKCNREQDYQTAWKEFARRGFNA
jgi:hypothetical protein